MIVLLDIDGVLVIEPPWKKVEIGEDGFMLFNIRAAENLVEILAKTSGEVVLTSTHRINYPEQKWVELFANRGIKFISVTKLNKITTLGAMKSRAAEILEWAETNTDDFIIIDDDSSLEALPEAIKKRWVRTNPLIGIDDEAKQKALLLIGDEQ